MDPNTQFDEILKGELIKRLKREPSASEVVNGDNDSDLVNEVLWQMINDLCTRVYNLENKGDIIK